MKLVPAKIRNPPVPPPSPLHHSLSTQEDDEFPEYIPPNAVPIEQMDFAPPSPQPPSETIPPSSEPVSVIYIILYIFEISSFYIKHT